MAVIAAPATAVANSVRFITNTPLLFLGFYSGACLGACWLSRIGWALGSNWIGRKVFFWPPWGLFCFGRVRLQSLSLKDLIDSLWGVRLGALLLREFICQCVLLLGAGWSFAFARPFFLR